MAIFRVPVRLTYSAAGGPGINVFHLRCADDTVLQDELQAGVDALHQFYVSIGNLLGASTLVECEVATNVQTDEAVAVDWTPIQTTNTGTEATLLALVISWKTVSATRRGKGRTFVGPLNSGVSESNGTPSGEALAPLGSAAAALVSSSQAANGWALAVYGQQNAGVAEPKVARDVIAYSVRDRFSVLRSRRPR